MDLSGLKKERVSGHAFLHLGVDTPGQGYEPHGSFGSNREGAELRRGHLPPTLIVALTPKRARGRRASRRPRAPYSRARAARPGGSFLMAGGCTGDNVLSSPLTLRGKLTQGPRI